MRKQFTIFLILIFVLGLAPVNFSNAANLSERLKGKILLQVELNGEAWYVNPDNGKRYFLGRPSDAFQVMRKLGLGISNNDFDSFNGFAPSRLSGKILLKIEDNGKAYYVNPDDLKMHYLGRPTDAFNLMRQLGLGITNNDLNDIATNLPELPELPDIDFINDDEKTENSFTGLFTSEKKHASINDFLSSVVMVECNSDYTSSQGSGFLYKLSNNDFRVFTNEHVIDGYTSCSISTYSTEEATTGVFGLSMAEKYNNSIDFASLSIEKENKYIEFFKKTDESIDGFLEREDLDYITRTNTEFCSEKMPVSTKVYIIGFPVFAQQELCDSQHCGIVKARTLTEGIISGYENNDKYQGIVSESNYYVTADIDSGNSGGLAIAVENDSFCLLGLPTWISVGNFENQGIVQNIHNVVD